VKRRIGWTVSVAVIAGVWMVIMFAPQLMQWVGLVWAIGLPVAGIVTFVRARGRGKRVAETLRPYGPDFITLQDDLLGRPHTAGAAWSHERSVPALVEWGREEAEPTRERRPETSP
jgi:hypothetical protein